MKSTILIAPISRLLILALLIVALALSTVTPGFSQGGLPLPQPLPVTVDNEPLTVVDIDSPARQPFQAVLCFGQDCETHSLSFEVPADRRAVVEYAAVRCSEIEPVTYPVTSIFVGLSTIVGGTGGTYPFLLRFDELSNEFNSAQLMRLYADPGELIHVYTEVGGGPFRCFVWISGYLITL